MELLVTAAVFLIVAGVVLAGYSVLSDRVANRAAVARTGARRLRGQPHRRPRSWAPHGRAAAPRRAVAAVGEFAMSGPNLPLAQRLSSAGFRSRSAVAVFVGTRILLSFGPALLVLMLQLSSGKSLGGAFFVAAMTWLFGHLLANYWLASAQPQAYSVAHRIAPRRPGLDGDLPGIRSGAERDHRPCRRRTPGDGRSPRPGVCPGGHGGEQRSQP